MTSQSLSPATTRRVNQLRRQLYLLSFMQGRLERLRTLSSALCIALIALALAALAFVIADILWPDFQPSVGTRAASVILLGLILWLNRDYCLYLVALLIALPASVILEDWVPPAIVKDYLAADVLGRKSTRIQEAIVRRRNAIAKLELAA